MAATKAQIIDWILSSDDSDVFDVASIIMNTLSLNQTKRIIDTAQKRFPVIAGQPPQVEAPPAYQPPPQIIEAPMQQQVQEINASQAEIQPPQENKSSPSSYHSRTEKKNTITKIWIANNNAAGKDRAVYHTKYKEDMKCRGFVPMSIIPFNIIVAANGYKIDDSNRRVWTTTDQ